MRFAQSIRLNSNPRWWGYYIPYEQLKARLARLHKLQTYRYVRSPAHSDSGISSSRERQSSPSSPRHQHSDSEHVNEDDGHEHNDEDSSDDEREDSEDVDEQLDDEEEDLEEDLEEDIENQRNRHYDQNHRQQLNLSRDASPTLHRTASDAVLTRYPPPDAPTSRSVRTDVLPSSIFSLEKKIMVPLLEVTSSSKAAILFKQEDEMFFRHLKQSVRTADEFYARMLYSLRHFVDDRQKNSNSIQQYGQSNDQPSSSDEVEHQHISSARPPAPLPRRSVNFQESSPLLPVTAIRPDGSLANEINNGSIHNVSSSKLNGILSQTDKIASIGGIRRAGEAKSLEDMEMEKEDLHNDCYYLFQEVHKMMNFAVLNVKAIEKILKKHDKLLGSDTKAELLEYFTQISPLYDTSELEVLSQQLIQIYATIFDDGNEESARKKLCYSLPDQIYWTRGTYWGDSLKQNLKTSQRYNVRGGVSSGGHIGGDGTMLADKTVGTESGPKTFVKVEVLLVAVILFILISFQPAALLFVVGDEIASKHSTAVLEAANRALALLLLCVVCWAGKAIPLHATSFLVFAAASSMGVFVDDAKQAPLDGHDASKVVVQLIGSPTVLLILCVYAFASALKKCQIDRIVATAMLKKLNPSGPTLIVFVMVLSVIVSLMVSNVASPVLLISIMQDLFMALNLRGPTNQKLVRGLLLSIMIACNVGGFVSPIASPQAAVAIGLLSQASYEMSFIQWIGVMLPLGSVMLICAYFVLVKFYHDPNQVRIEFPATNTPKMKYTWNHIGTVITLLATIAMWLIPWFSRVFGSTGVIGTLPMCVIFGSGILEKSDFMNLAWDVVILVAGGSVLGAAIQSSHLLDMLADRLLQNVGSTAAMSFSALCAVTTLISVFVSHTVSSIILLPLFLRIGQTFNEPQLFVLGGTAAASCAMATNVASFPNLTVSELQDEEGEYYLGTSEMTTAGAIMTVGCLFVLLTVGCTYLSLGF